MKRWWILGLLATVFTVLGAILALLLGREDPVGYWVGGVFLLVGLGMAWGAWLMRREEHLDEVAPPEARPGEVPWTEVAERIRARFEGTPYVVETAGSLIRVRADLADASFLTWAAAHHVREVRGVEVVATRPGTAITRDFSHGFEVSAGSARLTGSAHVFSGRSISWTRQVEYGVGTDGRAGKQVDIDFGSRELQRPVNEVLEETGWKGSWWDALPAEAKGGLVMGVIGGVGGLAAVVVALVDAIR